jgi:hypothetical protein
LNISLTIYLKHSITAGTRLAQSWKFLEAESYLEKRRLTFKEPFSEVQAMRHWRKHGVGAVMPACQYIIFSTSLTLVSNRDAMLGTIGDNNYKQATAVNFYFNI